MMKKFWGLAAVFLLAYTSPLPACTDFVIKAQDGSYISGRSLEFGQLIGTQLEVHPRGEKIQSRYNNQNGMAWTSKYAYAGLIAFDTVLDGFNEKGLALNILWFPDVKYPTLNASASPGTVLDFIDATRWILGNFSTVDEVKQNFARVNLYFHPVPGLADGKTTPPIHIGLHDLQGKSLVIEFNDGQTQIFDNPVGVLTNSPSFPWQLTNLRNYVNMTAIGSGPQTINNDQILPTGQGTGLLGIPGDWTPPSRFVRMTLFQKFLDQPKTASEGVIAAFHLLNTVDIPYGVVRGANNSDFDYTQWSTVTDMTNRKFYYRTYNDLTVKSIDLNQEKIDAGSPVKKIPINGNPF